MLMLQRTLKEAKSSLCLHFTDARVEKLQFSSYCLSTLLCIKKSNKDRANANIA